TMCGSGDKLCISGTCSACSHGSLLVAQDDPAEQALQVPLMQSLSPLPHIVPSRASAPSSQVRPSVPQTIRPSLHGAPGFVVHASSIGQADPSCGLASKL